MVASHDTDQGARDVSNMSDGSRLPVLQFITSSHPEGASGVDKAKKCVAQRSNAEPGQNLQANERNRQSHRPCMAEED